MNKDKPIRIDLPHKDALDVFMRTPLTKKARRPHAGAGLTPSELKWVAGKNKPKKKSLK